MVHKVPPEYESPVDAFLLKLSHSILPSLKSTGHTPNLVTTYSLITGLLSVHYLNTGQLYHFAGLYLLSYFFDCVDGHLARTYKMFSDFGDLYDHVSDFLVAGLLSYVVFKNYLNKITWKLVAVFGLATYLCMVHTGCRQALKNTEQSETIDVLNPLCPNPTRDIMYYRWFGNGSYVVFCILLILYIAQSR